MLDEEVALELTRRDMVSYRTFAFPPAVAQPGHDPFFSLEDPSSWITANGTRTEVDIDGIRRSELVDFRALIVPPQYIDHGFFSLDNAQEWVCLGAFASYALSKAPSASRPIDLFTRIFSCILCLFVSPSIPLAEPRIWILVLCGHLSSSHSCWVHRKLEECVESTLILAGSPPLPPMQPERHRGRPLHTGKGKGKGKQPSTRIHITREHSVERIIPLTKAPSTWTVDDDVAYRLDLSESTHTFFKSKPGAKNPMSIQRIIKNEDQDSWKATGGGHKGGDTVVYGFSDDLTVGVRAKRIHHHCNGVRVCELVPDELFADCERYEADSEAMLQLWHHVLDANEKEASSVGSILLRFYSRIF
ncbi:hypothetical protein C8F01DRAFT_1378655 [Mycena amicta]|nr:hypothetical protein C8F01DRAFT_1378655 [Mycena amicta]